MSNCAVIVFVNEDKTKYSPAIYLHWNGGIESINAFLNEMDRREIRDCTDMSYQAARFVHIVCDFFDHPTTGGLSVGIWNLRCLEANGDRTFYIYRKGTQRRIWQNDKELDMDEIRKNNYKFNEYEESIKNTFLQIRPKV